jgi:CBS domain-containing protein
MLVQHWMTRDPISIEAETPFLEARLILKDKKIRHLPVVDDAGTLVGMITGMDLRTLTPALAAATSSSA